MSKKLLSLLLAVVLITSMLPVIPALANDAWDGSTVTEPLAEDGVYQIGSGAELAWLSQASKTNANLNAVLTNDIDLGGKNWTPIGIAASGYATESFCGTFDGQGHTISNLYINTSSAFYGLFFCVYGGTVKNVNVSGSVTTTGNTAGGIVGKMQGGTIENCSFDGSVNAKGNYVGGIVGNILTNSKVASTVIGCCNSGEITGKTAGGILGYTTAKATVTDCYNTGTINGTTRSAGICGQQTTGAISYCYSIGNSASGISGFCNATITNCYYLNDETVAPGGTAKGYEKITDKDTLLDNLNAGENKLFCADSRNKNNGYPILTWQNKLTPEEEAAEQKKKEDTEKVNKAVEELTIDTSIIKESGTLNLPTEIGDCSVEWTSSDTDIISNNGTVTLPDKNIVNVTLTAKITCGEISDSKSFTISVWSENIEAEVYLQTVLDEMEWNFKLLQPVYGQDSNILVKFKNILKNKGFDGITITINSTSDESLITTNGKINYPVIDDNSFNNGKQVKVSFNLTAGDKTVTYPTTDVNALLIPWDTSSVTNTLEKAAEDLLIDTDLSAVTSDLTLPSNTGRNEGKYAFAWIEWKSSDEKHLAISGENRNGSADALYNPYIGKVYKDNEEHTVKLTAVITNPSTDVAITKDFDVVIAPLSDEELTQSLDMMNKIIDCYTADKLLNSATNEKLDITAVDNDIQLVIPSKVVSSQELADLDYGKYWDYWNYKFTISSSDTEVVEINSFRAYVYRPLGEDSSADKTVTLTVKMESKANPNLFVTKDIEVTVKHLSRAEVNTSLALMDQAKTNYAKGLLGNNADAYSVIDNLTPYKEIVWNKDKTGVEFVYRHADMQGSGIIVDELPDWEQQEDWRLFRTSNKDLIANETLILNKTPDEDTFVKINSVLTDETLGKYYTKFCNDEDYDAEALAKFKQLYKQPVSTYIMAVGAGNYTNSFAAMAEESKATVYSAKLSAFKTEVDKPIQLTFTLLGLDGAPLIEKTTVNSFTKGATVFDVFKKLLTDHDISYTAKGSYISSIGGLSEFDYGDNSGWMYTVGNVFVNSYMNTQELSGGEDIVVMYVKDYTLANMPKDEPTTPNPDDENHNSNSNNNNSNNNNNSDNNNNSNNNSNSNQNNNTQNSNNSTNNNQSNNTPVSVSTSSANSSSSDKKASSTTAKGNSSSAVKTTESTVNNTEAEDTATGADGTETVITENTDENDTSVSYGSSDKTSSKTPIIIGSVVGALLLALIIILIVLKNRRKNNEKQ